MDELNEYDAIVGYTIPDRTKCYICGHIFETNELRWVSPFIETLCDKCHSDMLMSKIKGD